jgi:mannose-6-phosphate isomerase-like protein (cupin superfamily)
MNKRIKIVHEQDIIPTKFQLRDSARLITKEREQSDLVSLHICTVPAPFESPEISYKEDELMYVIEGEGVMVFDGETHDFRPGTAMYIPAGCKYHQRATSDLKLLIIIAPPRLRSQWAQRDDLVSLEPEDALKDK